MLNYAFGNFEKHLITSDIINDKRLESIEPNSYITLPKTLTLTDMKVEIQEPTKLGEMEGEIVCSYENMLLGQFGMTITEEHYNKKHGIEIANKGNEPKKEKNSVAQVIVKVVLIILVILIVLYLFLVCYAIYRRRQRRRRRAELRRKKREREYRRHMRQMYDED